MLKASGVVLAGGKSSRMGTNKALLAVHGQTMIEHVVEEMRKAFREVIIVTNEPHLYSGLGVRVITDLIPGLGPLSGIHAGLTASSYEYSFVTACDMPFIDHRLAAYLVQEAPGYDVVVPQKGDYLEPLHAVYSKACIAPIKMCLENRIFKIIAFYPAVKVKFVGIERMRPLADLEKVFFNVNTPQELVHAREMAKGEKHGPKDSGS
ncbi:molybdenum cofactor guanylyltransferase [Calderihabitans maritimus]|uniref:Probable molybdenum cofactor guanylyltransferase n=1 Tax=Calderihabitans maritimus TaxID=1246530 RepID=A0A1Z5HRX9_9FIRM|nr:molybdenum cofactor guanylyltransferase [Calderihabitans maritimus]GAW92030.1 molybdenum cofactor guanylyltransferase [Calderihabitans maritimus]